MGIELRADGERSRRIERSVSFEPSAAPAIRSE
jgi:hypothetical protein